jgi:hypothetical protein
VTGLFAYEFAPWSLADGYGYFVGLDCFLVYFDIGAVLMGFCAKFFKYQ